MEHRGAVMTQGWRACLAPTIVLVVATASAGFGVCRAAGMNFYFTKPVSPSKLAQALATIS